jgi:anaerobic selenocysteine-containing dehydrogenase
MTNTWQDIKNADVVLVMGGNAAEAHPVRLQMGDRGQDREQRQAGRGRSALHPHGLGRRLYAPIRPGTDIAFLSGVIRYLLENDKIQHEYVRAYTNAGLIVKEGFGFEDLFTGYDEEKRSYDKSSWDYELDPRASPRSTTPGSIRAA